jgi:predicted amino acid racemase
MAQVKLYRKKLIHNYKHLDELFKKNNIDWAVVTKIVCGSEAFLREILNLGVKEVCDSRIRNLKRIKKMAPNVQTVLIKPPPLGRIRSVVKYADVSFNTESATIELLSAEAVRQNKVHKITIMIELGDLREGILGENLIDFYKKVFDLPNIEITSIGANLNCLHGVMPSQDKLIQLSLYKQLIEAIFHKKIPWVTGGTSVVIPLLRRGQVPNAINHFRVGEALYFGNDLFTGGFVPEMEKDVFRLFAEIIEITEKPKVPTGELAENPSGEVFKIEEEDYGEKSYRAIIDVGLLDIDPDQLIPDDPKITIINASSDMLIVNLGDTNRNYAVGESISFGLKYMGALRLLSSDYIEKVVV